jgi:excisionase family DNA binding protein
MRPTHLSISPPGDGQKPEPWVSVDVVAAHLGVRKDSVYRWIDSRGLPARKIGKLWKLNLSEVDAWVRARGAAEEAPTATSSSSKGASGLRGRSFPQRVVLVIDDDRLVRETVGDFLTDTGCVVLLASDGAEALTLLASTSPRPNLIILDLGMPHLDGWQFREQQARDPNLATIPVIVVTAVSNASVSGATVLRKPLRLRQLAKAMANLLEERPVADEHGGGDAESPAGELGPQVTARVVDDDPQRRAALERGER